MALVRNAANTLRKGRIGETTYYASKGRQIARQALNNSNYGESARRSLAQQRRRVKWANLVNFYKLCSGWMPKAFETKKAGQTDYNKFMQLNVNAQRVALTRDQAINGGCVVDGFAITQGTLPPVTSNFLVNKVVSTIVCTITGSSWATLTVGDLSEELISKNAFIKNGMQLSVVVVSQAVDGNDIPRASVDFYEVVLDTTSDELVKKYFPSSVFAETGADKLMIQFEGGNTAAAFIISELTDTGLKVSSETLVGNFSTAEQFSTAAVVEAAIATYGLDKEVVLNPDSAEPIV